MHECYHIMIYNKGFYTPTFTIYGLQNNDTLSGNLTFVGTYQTNYNTGNYTIIPSGLISTNYFIKYINGTLTITRAPLFIIANNDIQIFTNDISNYLLVYDPTRYNISNGIVRATQDIVDNNRIITLQGYDTPCSLKFNPPSNNCAVGLCDINNQYLVYIINNQLIINENGITNNMGGAISNNPFVSIEIKYDNNMITYSLNNTIIKSTPRNIKKKLYVNILLQLNNDYVTIIQFITIKQYYYSNNGFYVDGLQGDDTINDLSGTIIYSGTSQGASNAGIYTIVPSGLTSPNYNITFVQGYLTIKKSIMN